MNKPTPLLQVRGLTVEHRLPRDWPWEVHPVLRAVDGLDLELRAGETLGVVGESGSGKSTLARAIVGLQPVREGAILFDGDDLTRLDAEGWRQRRRDIQMVFQDPLASLDPQYSIARCISEPLEILMPELGAIERAARVRQVLEDVGLAPADAQRRPHEFSGGQCQRIALARALIVRPRLLICDEPVSALDVSIQAQIINLLREAQQRLGLTMLFIAHDLAVVRHISERVLVMYFGRVMEQAAATTLFAQPRHPYTRALLAAVPGAARDVAWRARSGERPSTLLPGCSFASRCPQAEARCSEPQDLRLHGNAAVRCWRSAA